MDSLGINQRYNKKGVIMGVSEKRLIEVEDFLNFLSIENPLYIIDLLFPIINRLKLDPHFIPDHKYSDVERVGWELIKKLAKV
jgi:hypothetical protein